MKCSECNGTGIDDDRLICYKCGGSGEVEMTNEEYIRSCSSKELEKLFEQAQDYGATCANGDKDKCSYCGCPWCEQGFMAWLKEKHK